MPSYLSHFAIIFCHALFRPRNPLGGILDAGMIICQAGVVIRLQTLLELFQRTLVLIVKVAVGIHDGNIVKRVGALQTAIIVGLCLTNIKRFRVHVKGLLVLLQVLEDQA